VRSTVIFVGKGLYQKLKVQRTVIFALKDRIKNNKTRIFHYNNIFLFKLREETPKNIKKYKS